MNRRLSGEKFDNPQNANNELGDVILKACEKQGKRYDSCEELISDLMRVKNDMSEDKLSKFLFEVDAENSKSDEHDDLEDTYILTQNDMDDTVLLDNSFGEYTDNVECIKNENTYESCIDSSIDDTVILDCGNEADLSESKLIDDTVVISEDIDIVEESTENLKNNEENKRKNTFLKTVTIATSLCLVLGFGYTHLKNKEKIEKEKARIEKLRDNLPKSSSKLGCLPGNLVNCDSPSNAPSSHIVTVDNIAFINNGGELGSYDETSEEPFPILTNTNKLYEPFSFNKYGNFIYYISLSREVQKYNTETGEISDVYGIYADQIIIMGDYMYYIEFGTTYHLYKINLIDGSKEKILNENIDKFSINSSHIVYKQHDDSKIYLRNLETKETNVLNINCNIYDKWIGLYENCILYIDENDNSLYRVDLNRNNIHIQSKEKIEANVSAFTLDGQYLYFIEGNANIEGGSSKLLVKDLLSNDTYYIADDALDINVDGGIMKYNSTDGYFYSDKFLPERYEKVNE